MCFTDDSSRIVENAAKAGVRFMVHENWRWQPWYRKIREIRDSGLLGDFTHGYLHRKWRPFEGDELRLVFGTMGADGQAQTNVQVLDQYLRVQCPERLAAKKARRTPYELSEDTWTDSDIPADLPADLPDEAP